MDQETRNLLNTAKKDPTEENIGRLKRLYVRQGVQMCINGSRCLEFVGKTQILCNTCVKQIPCGAGQTEEILNVAQKAFQRGVPRSLWLISPGVYTQLVRVDIPRVRSQTPLGLPFIKLGHLNPLQRELVASLRKKGCYILPYSLLSAKNGMQVLSAIAPQLILVDGTHNLKNNIRTKRLREYITNNKPEIVAFS